MVAVLYGAQFPVGKGHDEFEGKDPRTAASKVGSYLIDDDEESNSIVDAHGVSLLIELEKAVRAVLLHPYPDATMEKIRSIIEAIDDRKNDDQR